MSIAILVRMSPMENPNAPPLIELIKETTRIGRHGDVRMDTSRGKEVSKIHAKIFRRERGTDFVWLIEDNQSLNGTFVNGKKIHRVFLFPNDEIVFGGGTIFHMGDTVKSTELAECRYKFFLAPPPVLFSSKIDFNATIIHSAASEIDLCPICYFPIAAAETLPCGHQFCLGCIHEWARSCVKGFRPCICPMCRTPFSLSELAIEEGEITDGVASLKQIEPLLRKIDVRSCRTLRHSNIFTEWTDEKQVWFWNCYNALKDNELRRLTFLHLMHATYKYALRAKKEQLENAIHNLNGRTKETPQEMLTEVLCLIMKTFYKATVQPDAYTITVRSRPVQH